MIKIISILLSESVNRLPLNFTEYILNAVDFQVILIFCSVCRCVWKHFVENFQRKEGIYFEKKQSVESLTKTRENLKK